MRRYLGIATLLLLADCSSDQHATSTNPDGGGATSDGGSTNGGGANTPSNGGSGKSSNGGASTSSGGSSGKGAGGSAGVNQTGGATHSGGSTSGGSSNDTGGFRGYPDAFDPNDSPPKIGEPGCGFPTAAFCDTFGSPSSVRGRGGELDAIFWSAGRMFDTLSTTHAMSIGMAVIPECRPDVSNHVFPPNDTLICQPVFDLASGHLLVATAAQYYGQNGYRIRQPFDFAGRTGKIVFDASTDPLSPLTGWISLAVTEDPISMPGYSIQHNDEGSIIPKNAFEVHFANSGGEDLLTVRNLHVFKNYVDTVYTPSGSVTPVSHKTGKLNHYEFYISQSQIEVRVSPASDDGVKFAATSLVYTEKVSLPFTRGYVHVSLHNHATLKYTQPDSNAPKVIDASVARIDNVGFDGPVVTNWREYEVPDSLVKFNDQTFQPLPDPDNPQAAGVDTAYVVADTAQGPKQTLHFKGVDLSNVQSARLAVSWWVNFLAQDGNPSMYTLRARLNGKDWHDRKLSAEEAAFLGKGPTTVDPSGAPMGDPGTQGRLAVLVDVPVADLIAGDNSVEFVTANVPTSYPPLVCNVDLVMTTQ